MNFTNKQFKNQTIPTPPLYFRNLEFQHDQIFNHQKRHQMRYANPYQEQFFFERPPASYQYPHNYSGSNILLKCDECPKLFCSAEYLAIHKQTRHPKKEIVYIQVPHSPGQFSLSHPNVVGPSYAEKRAISETYCEICQRNFCNKYFLVKHKQTVHGKQDETVEETNSVEELLSTSDQSSSCSSVSMKKNWICHICKQKYYSFKYLDNHMKKKHQNERAIEQTEKKNLAEIKPVVNIKRNALLKLRKRLLKKLIKIGNFKKLPAKMSLFAMIRLSNFIKRSFGPFYKSRKWKKNYSSHLLKNTKSNHVKSYRFKRYLTQTFTIDFENSKIPDSELNNFKFPKKIHIRVRKLKKEPIFANIVLKPAGKNSPSYFIKSLRK